MIITRFLFQSMRSVDTLVSNTSLLDKMSVHLNGLLRNQDPPGAEQAVQLFDTMFSNALKNLETENDKQVLSVLKRQMSSFIGVTLGVRLFLEQHQEQELEEESGQQLSCADAHEKEAAWQKKSDFHAPENAEHERLKQQILDDEHYGTENHHGEEYEEERQEEGGEEDDDDDEYEEVVEMVPVKSREIGGAVGFEVVRRREKKKRATIATNFTYSHNNSYENYSNKPSGGNNDHYYKQQHPPRSRVRVTEFRPKLLDEQLPSTTFCIPVFFPSEESYSVSSR